MIHSLSTDFLIRIKNGSRAERKTITAPMSKFCVAIAQVLKKNGLIKDFSISGDVVQEITVSLAYSNGNPKITDIRLYSKPGRRFYTSNIRLPWGKTKEAVFIVSTSQGVMTQREAKVKGLGGELIAEIW